MGIVNYLKFNERLTYTIYTTHPWPDVEQWCNDNIGAWNVEWFKVGKDPVVSIRTNYLFRTKQQALMFLLMWG